MTHRDDNDGIAVREQLLHRLLRQLPSVSGLDFEKRAPRPGTNSVPDCGQDKKHGFISGDSGCFSVLSTTFGDRLLRQLPASRAFSS